MIAVSIDEWIHEYNEVRPIKSELLQMTLSTKILIGVGSGIGCGLFAGDYTARLESVGEAFIGLLQMTVLPYIVFSLIANIGRLSSEEARRLLRVGGTLLAIFLIMGMVALVVIPLSFPKLVSASFFSRSMIEPPQPINLLDLYIPSNPFSSLSSGTVPAIVLFSIAIGAGLISAKGKTEVIRVLDALVEALTHINKLALKFTPLGAFCIAAAAAGTMTLEEIGRLQAYLLSYSAAVALFMFLILPAMVVVTTPFRFGEVFRVFGSTLLLIFVTGKIIVILPQVIDCVKRLFQDRTDETESANQDAEILIPLIYPFPNLGTFVIFVFLPFTAWFIGRPLELIEYPLFIGATLLVSFVSPVVGIPFLLDVMKLPNDAFHLFFVSSVYTDRIRVALGGMHVFVLTVIAVATLHGMLRIRWRVAAIYAAGTLALVIVCVFGVRGVLSHTLKGSYTKDKVISQMQLLDSPVQSSIVSESAANPVRLNEDESLLDRIRRRGALRFGYDAQRTPFCFTNSSGQVVGFDVELMHQLAQTLGVRLEFVPTIRRTIAEQAAADHFDLTGCGFSLTSARSAALSLSAPYLDLHAAFVVPDYLRHDVDSISKLAGQPNLAIAVATDQEFATLLHVFIPSAKVVRLDTFHEFFDSRHPGIKVLFTTAETGSAMTLLHPEYSVVTAEDMKIAMPAVFVLSKNDPTAKQFLNDWLLLRQKNGVLDRLYDHWILGKAAERHGPRWSVLRNVLGWVQ